MRIMKFLREAQPLERPVQNSLFPMCTVAPTMRKKMAKVQSTTLSHHSMDDYVELEHQAAGHDGILSDRDSSLIFKPLYPQEYQFYKNIKFRPEDPSRPYSESLSCWMPGFLGTLREGSHTLDAKGSANSKPGNGKSQQIAPAVVQTGKDNFDEGKVDSKSLHEREFIVLENLLAGFSRPNIMDVKLGKVLYDENASDEKRERLTEVSNSTTSSTLGFRICGIKMEKNPMCSRVPSSQFKEDVNNGYVFIDKMFGRTRTTDTILDAFRIYLGNENLSPKRRAKLIDNFHLRLQMFYNALLNEEVRMISSSVLFIYEGDPKRWDIRNDEDEIIREEFPLDSSEDEEEGGEEEGETSEGIRSRGAPLSIMASIDFAHSRVAPGEGYDVNVIEGVENLIDLFRKLQEEEQSLSTQ